MSKPNANNASEGMTETVDELFVFECDAIYDDEVINPPAGAAKAELLPADATQSPPD